MQTIQTILARLELFPTVLILCTTVVVATTVWFCIPSKVV